MQIFKCLLLNVTFSSTPLLWIVTFLLLDDNPWNDVWCSHSVTIAGIRGKIIIQQATPYHPCHWLRQELRKSLCLLAVSYRSLRSVSYLSLICLLSVS